MIKSGSVVYVQYRKMLSKVACDYFSELVVQKMILLEICLRKKVVVMIR